MRKVKLWKRILGLAVSLTMLYPSTAIYAKEGETTKQENRQAEVAEISAQADENGFIIDEDGILTKYTGTDAEIVIPKGVTSIGGRAFSDCKELRSIILPEGLSTIGDYAFDSCSNLSSIRFPKSLTSIGVRAFRKCSSLTDLELPEGLTSIAVGAFENCASLTNINLPESLACIKSYAFSSCNSLIKIDLPKNIETVEGGAFMSCDNLMEINITEGKYKSYDGCLYDICSGNEIKMLLCPGGKKDVRFLEGVSVIDVHAFTGCSKLDNIELPKSVTRIEEAAFYGCRNLSSIELPNGMTYIGYIAFSYCDKLASIIIPESVTKIEEFAFMGDKGLTIYGKENSYAQVYAEEYGIPFEIFGEPTQPSLKKMSECQIILSTESYVYDGTKKIPTITVTDSGKVLTKDVDYAIAYQDNINVGKATLTLTGKGEYTGTVTRTYQIVAQDISKAKVELSKTSDTYDGIAKTPAVSVTLGGRQLLQNTDYTLVYANNTNVGTATVTVAGKGNYTGTVKAAFQITAKSISKAKIGLSQSSYTYDGKAKKPAVTVTLDKKKLSNKTDYTVSYTNNTKAGTATVTVTGKGNFTGTVKTTFTIQSSKKTKKSINKASVSLKKSSYVYDGKTKKPTVTVKLGKTTLKVNRDYTVSYKGNKNIGKATVTVTGKGSYTGKVSKTFTITAKKGTTFTVSGNKYKILSATQVSFAEIKNIKAIKVVIPATVKIGGKTFKVTSVAANALKNKTKVTSVIVGSNVTAIGSNAFYSCKKLGTITIKSTKLKTVGKNAFKGIKSTAKIKVPKVKEKAYKKLLKGKGQGKKVKIVRF